MFDFHADKFRYFEMQYLTARDHIIPFIESTGPMDPQARILEIGCGEAGVLKAFLERGHSCTGIELSSYRVDLARELQAEAVASGQLTLMAQDIYSINPSEDLPGLFDVILLKDVIEHIPDQERFLHFLHRFLAPSGRVFFGFPPWQMPFGGHQQIARRRFWSRLPFIHLLPQRMYQYWLQSAGESAQTIQELMEIKATGISIERFEGILARESYTIMRRQLFLLNPIYAKKFGWPVSTQFSWLSNIPYLRNFLSTAAYYVVRNN
ncbi:MAG: class I SAM-dependent methyltransferase [Lewinellaceae bacterium]|nr:class I SAM-dependent methyltransferase [Lewinellaceae bacterium]